MHFLFENWRKFLAEDDDATYDLNAADATQAGRGVPATRHQRTKEMLEGIGLELIRYIKSGRYGSVYEARDMNTHQQLAVKTTERRQERDAYNWLKENYESLPDEVQKHFPIVHDIQEVSHPDISGSSYAIVMEFLKPAPKEVIRDLFLGPGLGDDERLAARREDRFLSSFEGVKEVVDYCFLSDTLIGLHAVPDDMPPIEQLKKEVFERWATGDDPGPPTEFIDFEDQEFWELYTPKTTRLMNIMCDVWLSADPLKNSSLRFVIVQELVKRMKQIMGKQVVPVHQSSMVGGEYAGAGEGIESSYPEAESLMKAMKYMDEQGFTPMDVHYDNVLARPSTDELVIADLGNFRIGIDPRRPRTPMRALASPPREWE
jgi:serine/threonine protein kinase